MPEQNNALTRRELQRITGAEQYQIEYLHNAGRLPVVRDSPGPPHPRLYHPSAVDIVVAHLNRNIVPVDAV